MAKSNVGNTKKNDSSSDPKKNVEQKPDFNSMRVSVSGAKNIASLPLKKILPKKK